MPVFSKTDGAVGQSDGDAIKLNNQASSESSSIARNMWKGFENGTRDEIAYDREHYIDSAVRLGVVAVGGHLLADAAAPFKRNTKAAVVYGVSVSAAHFIFSPGHIEDVSAKTRASSTSSEVVGYVAGRLLTDASLTIGATVAVNKVSWWHKGEERIANTIENETYSYYQSASLGKRGQWLEGKTKELPIFRQERAQNLFNFLDGRQQTGRFAGLVERLKSMPEPRNIEIWSTDFSGVRTMPRYGRPIPEFKFK